ncbi:MAG: DUF4115 domain-containing protein [Rubellimicrobium sp.]|nr:DUF4115 domain-containing protein [Rubellimicrobium sp.]
MIRRGFWRERSTEEVEAKGFDAFELRLGDIMRGERATLGKSLLDVQRELKIKAAYIAAIENCDPTAFDTPGFIAGYVRSYARYLHMDPDWAFETFCRESGFSTAHGMSAAASTVRLTREERLADSTRDKDIFLSSATPFIPAGERIWAGIEPRAIGSIAVLVALIGGLGYGGWAILQEVQRVKFAPMDQAPTVVADVDPLAGASRPQEMGESINAFETPPPEALDRLYRPQALDVPVLVARDGPISTLSPGEIGVLASPVLGPDGSVLSADAGAIIEGDGTEGTDPDLPTVRVNSGPVPELQLIAVRPAWVRVQAANGSTLFEGILEPGDTFDVPVTEEPARLRVGESGALYFAVNGVAHGPVGARGMVTSNVALSPDSIVDNFAVADLGADADLAQFVAVAQVEGLTDPEALADQ